MSSASWFSQDLQLKHWHETPAQSSGPQAWLRMVVCHVEPCNALDVRFHTTLPQNQLDDHFFPALLACRKFLTELDKLSKKIVQLVPSPWREMKNQKPLMAVRPSYVSFDSHCKGAVPLTAVLPARLLPQEWRIQLNHSLVAICCQFGRKEARSVYHIVYQKTRGDDPYSFHLNQGSKQLARLFMNAWGRHRKDPGQFRTSMVPSIRIR